LILRKFLNCVRAKSLVTTSCMGKRRRDIQYSGQLQLDTILSR